MLKDELSLLLLKGVHSHLLTYSMASLLKGSPLSSKPISPFLLQVTSKYTNVL